MGNELRLENQKIALEFANFTRKEAIIGNLKPVILDRVFDLSIGMDDIKFKFERKVSLEPDSLFNVSVIFSYVANFNMEIVNKIKEGQIVFDNKRLFEIVNNTNMPQVASLIISNLTSINGNNPLITPPIAINK